MEPAQTASVWVRQCEVKQLRRGWLVLEKLKKIEVQLDMWVETYPKPSLAYLQAQPMSSSRHLSIFSEMEDEQELYLLMGVSRMMGSLPWGEHTMRHRQ